MPVANILVAQPLVPPAIATAAERDAHVQRMVDAAKEAVESHRRTAQSSVEMDFIAFPEISTISYSKPSFDAIDELAEDIDVTPHAPVGNSPRSPSLQAFAGLARFAGCPVCFGVPRRDPDGVRWISQVVVSPLGLILGHFDKMHMINFGEYTERRHFGTPVPPSGSDTSPTCPPLVLNLCGGAVRVAPIICYDIRFPELSRHLAVECGVHAILHASAFPRDELFAARPAFIMTRAIENQFYFIGMNRAGPDFGDTIVAPPNAASLDDLAHHSDDEEFILVKVDTDVVAAERQSRHFLADRLASSAYVQMKATSVEAARLVCGDDEQADGQS